jgi:site-specific recombinase XerD
MGPSRPRQPRPLAAGPFQPVISSFRLHLNAEGKSPKTVRTYVEAVQWFAAAYLRPKTDRADWSEVRDEDVQEWLVYLLDHYSDSYANNQYRALQQFFKWYSEEEELPNPMARMKPPQVGEKVIPVFTEEELSSLSKTCKGRTFVDRRDRAIIELFKATGIRLSEMAGVIYDPEHLDRNDIDLDNRELRVHGKARKERIVKFNYGAARAIDRYLRLRSKHAYAIARSCGSGSTTVSR